MPKRIFVLLMVLLLILAGCRQQAEPTTNDNINIGVSFEPSELAVGESTVLVTITDAAGTAITDATINVRGDMSHAGMVPVIRDITSGENGVYRSDFEWTMGGDWQVTVTVTLPDGTSTEQRFDYTVGN